MITWRGRLPAAPVRSRCRSPRHQRPRCDGLASRGRAGVCSCGHRALYRPGSARPWGSGSREFLQRATYARRSVDVQGTASAESHRHWGKCSADDRSPPDVRYRPPAVRATPSRRQAARPLQCAAPPAARCAAWRWRSLPVCRSRQPRHGRPTPALRPSRTWPRCWRAGRMRPVSRQAAGAPARTVLPSRCRNRAHGPYSSARYLSLLVPVGCSAVGGAVSRLVRRAIMPARPGLQSLSSRPAPPM